MDLLSDVLGAVRLSGCVFLRPTWRVLGAASPAEARRSHLICGYMNRLAVLFPRSRFDGRDVSRDAIGAARRCSIGPAENAAVVREDLSEVDRSTSHPR